MATDTREEELLDALDERRTIAAAGGDLGPIDRKIGGLLERQARRARQLRRETKAAGIEKIRRAKGFDPLYTIL
jgi:hypothetical protein